MELVAKSSAVAVSDELTTLINWTNIESLAGFTVVIENVGGGSGDDITDVQIDTSTDGGTTSSLDQHAGVPAVPVTAGNAKRGTFTETAAFVRIRALCASDKDTTAIAYLLADSSVGRICTLADVKDYIGETKTDYDSIINKIILGAEALFNNFTFRNLILNTTDETVYLTGNGTPRLVLPRYPVLSITSLKEAIDYDFDLDTLVANTDYRLVAGGKNGIIYRMGCNWYEMDDSIQVIYKGGYVPAGQTPGTGETAMPADLREAAIMQTSFIFKRKDDIGLSAVSFQGGSINKFSEVELLPMVKDTLLSYRRPTL